MEHTDDDSYEMVDCEEFCHITTKPSDLNTDDPHMVNNNTDDDSYEFIDSEEINSCMKYIDELLSAQQESQRNEIEDSDLKAAEIFNLDNISAEGKAGDLDELLDSEELSDYDLYDYGDMDMEVHDPFETYKTFKYMAVADQRADCFQSEYPPNIMRREDMKIKDVAKDHIIHFLPAKSLMKFRTVSKEWNRWITSPFLAHRQSCHYRSMSGFFCQNKYGGHSFVTLDKSAYGIPEPNLGFLPESVVVRSSCNGLLLCQGCFGDYVYYICNPANKEWDVLPNPTDYHGDEPNVILVFEPSYLNFEVQYQVISAFPLLGGPVICFDIYSSATRSWKRSEAECFELDCPKLVNNMFYMKGVAFWETTSGELLAFDMKNEVCGILPLPCDRKPNGVLSEIDGELSYIQASTQAHVDEEHCTCLIEIFGGMNMHMRHSISIDLDVGRGLTPRCRVLLSDKGKVFIILVGNSVCSYNVKDQKLDRILCRAEHGVADMYIPYVNSLVSLCHAAD